MALQIIHEVINFIHFLCFQTDQMSNPEHFGYVKPRSNLPVNPDPAFYRSASNAAAVRAKEIENERKVRSLPPSKGAKQTWAISACALII